MRNFKLVLVEKHFELVPAELVDLLLTVTTEDIAGAFGGTLEKVPMDLKSHPW